MRIIITSKGKNEVRDLEYLTEKKRNKTVSYGKQFRRTFTINKSKDNPLSKKKRTETEMGKTVRPSVMMASPFSALSITILSIVLIRIWSNTTHAIKMPKTPIARTISPKHHNSFIFFNFSKNYLK